MTDRDILERVRSILARRAPAERKMFGGVCFMLNGNMLAGTFKGDLLVRVGRDSHETALQRPHTRPMEQAGRVAAGYVIVAAAGVANDRELKRWLDTAIAHVETLPAKDTSARSKRARAKGEKK
jgi:TfoX/Sxy family transcriptional regulator of competence genes